MISVYQGKLFPFKYRVAGYLIPLAVAIKFITNTVYELSMTFYAISLLVSVILLFTDWTLEIYPDKKNYRKCISFLMFRIGWGYSFREVEKIYFNQINDVYKAYIKFDDGEKLLLDCDTNQEALINRLMEYNQSLKTHILDNSDVHNPRWITLDRQPSA